MTTLPLPTGTTSHKANFLLLLSLIVAGLAGNYFKFPIFLNIDFLFGSIFAMLALQFFGLGRGIVAAAIIAGYTYTLWNHPYAIIIMTAEVAAVGWMLGRRKRGLVLADTLYWLIIGMPLVYLFYHVIMGVSFSNTYIVMIKQAINGIANALVARLIFTSYTLRSRTSLTSYRDIVYNLLAFFVLCPALILLAVGSRTDFAKTESQIRSMLIRDSKRISLRLHTWVLNRKTAVICLAEMAAKLSPAELQPRLEQAFSSDVNFIRGGLQDKNATSTAYFPLIDELGQKNIGKNFSDRPYIPILKQTLKPVLSEIMMGKIGIPKPVVALIAPVVIGGEYSGFVGGILSLDQLQEHLDKSAEDNFMLYTLLDKNGNVIMTNRADQKVMTPFARGKGTINLLDKGISQWVPLLPPNTPISERWKKSFYVAETAIGDLSEWKLMLEQPVAPFQKSLYDNYTGKLTLLFLILLGALALAELLSRRFADTLEKLRLITHDLPKKLAPDSKDIDWPESSIIEAQHLISNFKDMSDSLTAQFKEVQEINETLEQRVEERTNQLAAITNELSIILETAPFGISKMIDRKQVWVNRKTENLLKYSKEELESQTTRILYTSDAAYEKFGHEAYPALAQGVAFETVQEWITKEGIHIQVRGIGKAIEPPDMSKGTIWMLEDITERNRAEMELLEAHHQLEVHQIELQMQNEELRSTQAELEESQASYFDLYDLAPTGYLALSEKGLITRANLTVASLLGVMRDSLVRQPFSRFISKEDQDVFYRFLKQHVEVNEVQSCELRLTRTDGTWLWVHVKGTLTDKSEFWITLNDISEQKQAEENIIKLNNELEARVSGRTSELVRINQELEGFCYAISHEFRAPIARMEGFGNMLVEIVGQGGKDQLLHCSQRIVAASTRLRAVIDGLLTLNRLSRAEMTLLPVNLSEMSQQIATELLEQNEGRTITVTIAPDIVVQGDRYMLEICMHNLLGNAFKYTSKTTDASIEFGKLSREGVETCFVRDNGVGFDMSHVKNLFVPFCRLHTESEFEGTGIGLATVHRIIEKHNGRIWAEAVPGKGATFYFTLMETGGSK